MGDATSVMSWNALILTNPGAHAHAYASRVSDDHWSLGEVVVRREWLHGHPWVGFATYVVEDSDDLLAVYLAEGSQLAFPDWPFDQWVHPWFTAGHRAWHGDGKLML